MSSKGLTATCLCRHANLSKCSMTSWRPRTVRHRPTLKSSASSLGLRTTPDRRCAFRVRRSFTRFGIWPASPERSRKRVDESTRKLTPKKSKAAKQARVETSGGGVVTAGAVVVATNTPVNDLIAIHTKQAAYQTYVIGARIPRRSVTRVALLGYARSLSLHSHRNYRQRRGCLRPLDRRRRRSQDRAARRRQQALQVRSNAGHAIVFRWLKESSIAGRVR